MASTPRPACVTPLPAVAQAQGAQGHVGAENPGVLAPRAPETAARVLPPPAWSCRDHWGLLCQAAAGAHPGTVLSAQPGPRAWEPLPTPQLPGASRGESGVKGQKLPREAQPGGSCPCLPVPSTSAALLQLIPVTVVPRCTGAAQGPCCTASSCRRGQTVGVEPDLAFLAVASALRTPAWAALGSAGTS